MAPSMSGVSLAEATLCSESPASRVPVSAHLHPCGVWNVRMGAGLPSGPALLNSGTPSAPAECGAGGRCDLGVSSEGQPSLPPGTFASSLHLPSFSGLQTAGLSLTSGGALFWRAHQPQADWPAAPTTLRLGGLCSGPACPAPSHPSSPLASHRGPRPCLQRCVELQPPPALPWPQQPAFCRWELSLSRAAGPEDPVGAQAQAPP